MVESGTVGPEAIASTLSLTTLDKIRVTTFAGKAFLRSPPPFI